MNQCSKCNSYALNDAPETGLCDKCVLRKCIEELEDELLRLCDLIGEVDVSLVHKLLGIKDVEDEE